MGKFVEYVLRIPQEVDDFITDVVARENTKKGSAKDRLNNDAFLQMIFRDWYLSVTLPNAQRQASIEYGKKISELWSEIYNK